MKRGMLPIVVIALGTLALGVAEAAGPPGIDTKGAKHKDGPYLDDIQQVRIRIGSSKTLYWEVTNNTVISQNRILTDAATGAQDTSGYNIKWFRGKTNISTDVKGTGYEFTLQGGGTKRFSARIKHKSAGSDAFCLGAQAEPIPPNTEPPADGAFFAIPSLSKCK
jgi:hypothetical protein